MKLEVDKCILVCSNCHAEIHEEIRNFGFSVKVNKISKGSYIPINTTKIFN